MTTTLFSCLTYVDAARGMVFLDAVGFTRKAVYESAPGVVEHAEYAWGDRGGLMFGSSGRRSPGDELLDNPGVTTCYCVVDADPDVDAVYQRAIAAGARTIREPEDQDYGGRSCTVADPEGNQFSFGSYPGA